MQALKKALPEHPENQAVRREPMDSTGIDFRRAPRHRHYWIFDLGVSLILKGVWPVLFEQQMSPQAPLALDMRIFRGAVTIARLPVIIPACLFPDSGCLGDGRRF